MRVYRIEVAAAPPPRPGDLMFRLDRMDDLQLYEPLAPGDPTREELLRHARVRLDAGAHVYTVVEGPTLQHFSWMTARGESPGVTFQEGFELPERAAFLWDAYTHPGARGKGIQGAGLRRKVADAAAEGARFAYVAVAADNGPSRRNIERNGFEHVYSVHTRRLLHRTSVRGVPRTVGGG